MSEMKRVTLTTISDVVRKSPFGGAALDQNTESIFSGAFGAGGGLAASGGKNGTAGGKPRKTVRLELALFEPTAQNFPEFNFSKLMHEEQKRQRKAEKKASTTPNGFLSDADNDDDVARIARELEKKYGSGTAYSSSGKSARPSQLDFYDRGAGYDEEDSFIDNTEAYDELIPEEVETVGGGFYINSGQLEFKTLSNFERPDDAIRMPKPKKRLLSTSSESGSEEGEKEEEKKKDELGSATSGAESGAGKSGKVERKRLNGHVGKKQKMTTEKMERKLQEKKKKKKEAKETKDEGEKEVKVVKTITVKDMLRAKRDSMRKMEQEKKGRSSATVSSSEAEEDGDDEEEDDEEEGSEASDSDSSESGSEESESESATGSEQEPPKVNGEEVAKKQNEVRLPDNLPDHLLQDLNDLKEIADKSTGKLNFFDTTVADLLLQIDVSSRMCGGSARNSIYKHLEEHLRVSRQTLMIKIKKIRIRKEDNKVKAALDKLESAVTELMPKIIANYEAEKQKAIELRNSLPAGENGEKPEVKHPKKKFPWNDHLRGLLFSIASIRKQSFVILRPRKETEADFIQSYLRKHVVPLWPSGWVKFEDLQKELDRRKKNDIKAASKETKKTVHLSSVATADHLPTQALVNGPGSKPDSVPSPSLVKPAASKPEERKTVRPPQSSPVVTAVASPSQPPPSTSPAATKRTSDHSIINIISSPPSKTSSSQHSSHYPSQPSPQPPRPQSQPPRQSVNFDEDLIQAHVINLEAAHSASKSSPHPMDYRINSPALSSASSASSSRRQSSYQEQPPMAHSNSTPGNSNLNNRKSSKGLDDDSDSSIEIVGEYNMGEKKADLALNLALPSINKDKYKKSATSAKSGNRPSSESGASTSGNIRGSPMNINNNNNNNSFEKATKYRHSPSPASSASTMTTTSSTTSLLKTNSAGSFALPTSVASLMQDLKSNSTHTVPPRMSSAPGELDVLRIMKELHELQAIQISNSNKAAAKHGNTQNNRGSSNSPKPTHTYGPKPKQQQQDATAGSASIHQTPKSTAASQQQQKQQQAHHSSSTKVIELDSFEDDFLFANYSYDSAKKRTYNK